MTWYSQSSTLPGSDIVQWNAIRGRYIVGVYNRNATSDANYYITEYVGPIALMNGQGQQDYADGWAACAATTLQYSTVRS